MSGALILLLLAGASVQPVSIAGTTIAPELEKSAKTANPAGLNVVHGIGDVIARQSRWDEADGRIYTFVTLRLEDGKSIVVRQLGGRVGEKRLTVIGSSLMKVGQHCRLTLLPSGEGYFHPYEIHCDQASEPACGGVPFLGTAASSRQTRDEGRDR